MKYIILNDNTPVIFPDTASHDFIAANRRVRSAGFCMVETYRNQFDDIRAKVTTWGRSESLNIDSSPEDASILERLFFC